MNIYDIYVHAFYLRDKAVFLKHESLHSWGGTIIYTFAAFENTLKVRKSFDLG